MSINLVVLVVTSPSGVYLPGIGSRNMGDEIKVTPDRAEYLLTHNPGQFKRKTATAEAPTPPETKPKKGAE